MKKTEDVTWNSKAIAHWHQLNSDSKIDIFIDPNHFLTTAARASSQEIQDEKSSKVKKNWNVENVDDISAATQKVNVTKLNLSSI